MSEVMVTGAAGYIGSAVASRLAERGADVLPVDNFRAGKVDTIRGIEIEDVDVRDREALRTAMDGVDAVLHLAAVTGVPDCEDHPEEAFDTNVGGTANVAWLCRRTATPLVYPASMAIIGDPVEVPITPEHPRGPLNLYGRTKQMGEDDIHALAEDSFPSLVFMKSNLYGQHHIGDEAISKHTVINIFIDRALDGEPLTVHEPGTQARDFIHVLDVARAYELALEYLLDAPDGARTIPLASGESRSVLEIAETVQRVVEEETGETIEIELVENPRGSETVAEDFTVDTEPARSVIGFNPDHTIEGTIREMVRQ